MLSRLKSRLKQLYVSLIVPPWCWKAPEKSDILIYDAEGSEELAYYLQGYSVAVFPKRGEVVYIVCLMRSALRLAFWQGAPAQSYLDSFIRAVAPKVILTFIDNDKSFYSISNRFPDLKTIFVQNGLRSEVGDVFGSLARSDKYHVDYMLVHGSAIGRHYQKFISGAAIAIGSIKNNRINPVTVNNDRAILYISQYHDKPETKGILGNESDGTLVTWDQFFAADVLALQFIRDWCVEHNKFLRICARGREQQGTEYDFFSSLLKGCQWEFVPRTDALGSYKMIDSAEMVVSIDSTLGYEAMGRGKKTACFSCRGWTLNNEATRFGWPAKLPENGPFWTNAADETEFRRILGYLNALRDEEWQKVWQPYSNDLMDFDAGNTRFISLLDRLLQK
jgi:surface carbohydrate biosynthesis protein